MFIVSSHFGDSLHVLNPSNTIMILFYDAHLVFFRRTSQDICFAISLERTDFLLLFVCLFVFTAKMVLCSPFKLDVNMFTKSQ